MDEKTNRTPSSEMTNEWIDRLEIIRVFDGYFRALDEKDFGISRMEQIFSTDAEVIRPHGIVTRGPEEIGTSHSKSFARFRSTQHLISNHDVSVKADSAEVRANLVAIHIWADTDPASKLSDSSFIAGGVVVAQAVRTPQGWRISKTTNNVIWREGTGFSEILKTGK